MIVNRKHIIFFFIAALILFQAIGFMPMNGNNTSETATDSNLTENTILQEKESADIDNSSMKTLAEGEWTQWNGESSSLPVQAYGNRTDHFYDNQIRYFPNNSSTRNTSLSIPMENGWEGHKLFVSVTSLTENRTWVQDPDMENSPSSWTVPQGAAGGTSRWQTDGHGTGDDCVEFDLTGDPNVGEKGYTSQTFTVDRGDVVWAGIRLDYWIDSNWGADGFVAVYVLVETTDLTQRVWQKSFPDVDQPQVWYDSGLINITDLSLFDLSDGVYIEVGLYNQAGVGINYSPNLDPLARVDNVELYLMTETKPSQVNLTMNGLDVEDYSVGAGTVYGKGNVTQYPSPTWTSPPVAANFNWTPSSVPPSPNRTILVDFDVETNLYARTTNYTIKSQDITDYGETFIAYNASENPYIEYLSWFDANIPENYDNRYYFNITLPENRDVYHVGSPLLTDENITEGWDEQHGPKWYANVSAYLHTDRWGTWLIKSRGLNMITDVLMVNSSTGKHQRILDLRFDSQARFVALTSPEFVGTSVNFTVFNPNGIAWYSEVATVNSTGHAETSDLQFDSSAIAGEWVVQVFSNNSIAGSKWNKTGFFHRKFDVIHSSIATLLSPGDAVSTWITNVTYPDSFLIKIQVNDSDIPSLGVPSGIMTYNWTDGSHQFNENPNKAGEYLAILESEDLYQKGQYLVNITWNHPYFDSISNNLKINLNWNGKIILLDPDSSTISVPVEDNVSFTVRFEDAMGGVIDYGTLECDWSGPYSINPISGSPGTYKFWLNTTGFTIGNYKANVTARANFIITQTMNLSVIVREIDTQISYLQNRLEIPVGEAKWFVIDWYDVDHDSPLDGRNDSIICNWSEYHSFGDQNYTVDEISPGEYNITIFTMETDLLGTYPVKFNLTGTNLETQQFVMNVVVQTHSTSFRLDDPIAQTSHGDTIVVLVFYQDTDLGIGVSNITGNVEITVTASDIGTLSFDSAGSSLGTGHYNITIQSGQWGTTGWKNLTINVEWTHAIEKYAPQTIDATVQIIGRRTDLFIDTAPVATRYLNNFTFTAVFMDAVNSSKISNSTGGAPGNVFVLVTPIGPNNPATQSDFTIRELLSEPGTYEFEINTTSMGDIDTFTFEIAFMWSSTVMPRYENQSLTINLKVLKRLTYIDHGPNPSTPFGEFAEYVFSYVDSLSNEKISNSSALEITIVESGIDWYILYEDANRLFSLNINSSSFGGIGIFTLHLNITWQGEPYYVSLPNYEVPVTVTLRNTKLTKLSFIPPQWGMNISIDFIYTDLVSQNSTGMTGNLSLVGLNGWYSVTSLGNGQYRTILNTSAFVSDGIYSITADIEYTGSNYASDASVTFDITIMKRLTQLGYETPDPTPYLEILVFPVTYIDDSTGSGIDNASVTVTCQGSAKPLVKNDTYWIDRLGNGRYQISVNSSALGGPSAYSLNVTVTKSGQPFYQPLSRLITSRVSGRPTVILITKTPEDTPFEENITFTFKFIDFLNGALVPISKDNITLTHGENNDLLGYSQFIFQTYSQYYEIGFNSTLLNNTHLISGHKIILSIDRSISEPFYDARNITTQVTTIERPTQIQFPLIPDTPYGDNISISFEFIDYLSGDRIKGADITIVSVNLTNPIFYEVPVSNEHYQIHVPSTQFGAIGTVYFTITVNKTGIPFYSSRNATNIPATIRLIIIQILATTPPAGSVPIGDLHTVNVTVLDVDHGIPLSTVTLATNWFELNNRDDKIQEIGNGKYNITLNTTGLVAQRYTFNITATKINCSSTQIEVSIQPAANTVEIQLDKTTYYADWGEGLKIQLDIVDSYRDTLLSGMNVTLLWNFSTYTFNDLNNGTYDIILDTSDMNYGNFEPQIKVSREYYQTRQRTFSLIVSKAIGQIKPEQSLFNVVVGTDFQFWIYLNDTTSNRPVTESTLTAEWNNTEFTLYSNGTDGFYIGEISTVGFLVGQYELLLHAFSYNLDFLGLTIDIDIIPVPTSVKLSNDLTSLSVYYGDPIELSVEYNDTHFGGSVSNANVSFTFLGVKGQLVQQLDGSYYTLIDTLTFGSQNRYLQIYASKTGYASKRLGIFITIQRLPTNLTLADETLTALDGFFGQSVTFQFNYTDTYNIAPIENATVIPNPGWEDNEPIWREIGNGQYEVEVLLDNDIPGRYNLVVELTKTNYVIRKVTTTIIINPTPAEIVPITGDRVDIPKNDTSVALFYVYDSLNEVNVSGLEGYAYWTDIGEQQLLSLGDGLYALNLTGYRRIGLYNVEIVFLDQRYSISSYDFLLEVRSVNTRLNPPFIIQNTFPGGKVNFIVSYIDEDHDNASVLGATVIFGDYKSQGLVLTVFDELPNNGIYFFEFSTPINETGVYNFTITIRKTDFETQNLPVTITSSKSEVQAAAETVVTTGTPILAIIALLVAAWIRHFSVPTLIRGANRMIRSLQKGKIPPPEKVLSRADILLKLANEELEPVVIIKTMDDVVGETIVIEVPEVEDLLVRLAEITGLGPEEIEAFRADLARMRPSERSGFLREVITQEEARRAEALAGEEVEIEPVEKIILEEEPDELEELKDRLLKKGMAMEEIEIILEQAKTLSKADLEALLDSLGISLD